MLSGRVKHITFIVHFISVLLHRFPHSGRDERLPLLLGQQQSGGNVTSSSTDPPVPLPGPGLCGRNRWAGAEGCSGGDAHSSPEDPTLAGLDWFLEFGSNKQMENDLSNWPPLAS